MTTKVAKPVPEYKKTGISKRGDGIGLFWEDHVQIREKKEAAPARQKPEATWLKPDYLPGYAAAAAFRPNLITLQEFLTMPSGTELLFDVECYPNFFCVTFECYATGKQMYFELSPWCALDMAFLRLVWMNHTKTGFYSKNYDTTMVELALAGLDNASLKKASDLLIVKDEETGQAMRPYDVLRHFGVKKPLCSDHIDIIEVAPLRAKLKIYAGRLHTPYMQDLPFPPSTHLNEYQAVIVRHYNFKDIIHTRYLRMALQPQLELRYDMSNEYQEDLRSRSDAQIAETVMRKELGRKLGKRINPPKYRPDHSFAYRDPGFLRFQTKVMQDVFATALGTQFFLGPSGNVLMPKALADLEVTIGEGVYRMGIGGLHSSEKSKSHVAGGGYRILDRDVTSYYPYLILNQGLYPLHIGFQFLVVYRGIVDQRIHAKTQGASCKAQGDKAGQARWEGIAQSLKIVINGAYGKLGSPFSCLYAPELLIQTTITGQLSILMLIEAMHCVGIQTISANTDGITMKVHETQQDLYGQVLKWWEGVTNFNTEETEYLAMYSRDVNNYIAVKKPYKEGDAPSIKAKGAFANPWADNSQIEPWLHINPTSQICVDAIQKLLTTGKAIEQTIRECKDMSQFINVRTVSKGAVVVTRGDYKNRTPSEKIALMQQCGWMQTFPTKWSHPTELSKEDRDAGVSMDEAYRLCVQPTTVEYLGESVRWYYAKDREQYEIVAAETGNRVGSSDGAMPCMDLPRTIPEDLDYDWYINNTHKILKQIDYA